MHELGLTRSVVAIVSEAAKGRRVGRVTLDIGAFAGVMPQAIAFCFDIVAEGTPLAGARLEINEIKGRARCRCCGADFATTSPHQPCACGARDVERLAGEEFKIREMELLENA